MIRLLGVAAVVCCLGSGAAAFELFGFRFFEPAERDTVERIDPLPYTIALQVDGGDEDLEDAVRAASHLIDGADAPAAGRAGLLSTANGDYARIVNALYELGHFGPVVSIRLAGLEAADAPLDVRLPGEVPVEIRVRPGPTYTFGRVDIRNPPPGFSAQELDFVQGGLASALIVRDVSQAVTRQWRERSRARAEVTDADIVADHRARTLDVRLTVTPGPEVTYGPLSISGSKSVDHAFLRYMAKLPRGFPYHPDEVDAARRRLVKLDTFRSVTIDQSQALTADNTLPISVDVIARKPRRFGFGATFSNVDGLGLEGYWLHRNLFGRAERLRFDGSIGGVGRSLDPTDYDYEATGTYIMPGFITPDTEYNLTVSAERLRLDTYESLSLLTSTGLKTRFSDTLSGETAFAIERSRIDDNLGRRRFSILSLDTALTFDNRDDPLDATSGVFVEGRVMPFIERRNHQQLAFRGTLEGRAYWNVGPQDRDIILAARGRIGTVDGIPLTGAPPQTLFFSGGGGTVRGFKYLSNGVDLGGGTIVGGRSLAELSAEVRVDFTDSFSGVAFVDAGNVGATPFPDFDSRWQVGAGLGIRFDTGLGPLRVDLARALPRRAGDPVFALYIGLGQAF